MSLTPVFGHPGRLAQALGIDLDQRVPAEPMQLPAGLLGVL